MLRYDTMGEAFYISLVVPLPMTLLARWGGEEFVVLLPHTPLEYARQLAEGAQASCTCCGRCRS